MLGLYTGFRLDRTNSENKPLSGMYARMYACIHVCIKSENKFYLAGMVGRVAIRSSDFRSVERKKDVWLGPIDLRNLIKLGLQRIYDCELQLPKAVYTAFL